MFNGLAFGSGEPRRAFLPRAMLPFLQAQGSEAAVRGLAVLFASESVEAARWIAINDPGRRDVELWCPASEDAHPRTPPARAATTLAMLTEACSRFKAITGQDGLILARSAIGDFLGDVHSNLIASIMRPLERAELDIALEAVFILPRDDHPPPTLTDRQELAEALLDELEGDCRLAGIKGALTALVQAATVDPSGTSPTIQIAVREVQFVLQHAVACGVEASTIADLISAWSNTAPGAPRLNFNEGSRCRGR